MAIQTSAVIVLGAQRGPAEPPPSPPTPCISPDDDGSLCEPLASSLLSFDDGRTCADRRIGRGLHVLATEAAALANLSRLYETDTTARDSFAAAVRIVARQGHGKLVVIGVGKSGHIGRKLVATLQSLAIRAVFLHPTEALHGDLGIVGPHDALLFISFSGRTHELLKLLPHLDEALPTIVLTSHTRPETCELLRRRPTAVLLPAPIPEPEEASFGVPAPSTSTTVALALCDALAVTAADELHCDVPAEFARNHPGGAIGADAAAARPQTLKEAAVPWNELAGGPQGLGWDSLGADLLRAGYDSPSGWVRVEDGVATPDKIRRMSTSHLCAPLGQVAGVVATRQDMISMPSDTTISLAARKLWTMMQAQGETLCGPDSVIAVVEGDGIVGVVEAGQVLAAGGRHVTGTCVM
ncbi:hypothetical protein L249_8833 [Ophiocordyceps polyrhachis-furcata BCC 54312]|uniref:SIS domain-containing protein n=1 Tax=Ophiocordyceps polyrhachis-furcata BCC 54312 TaxID=1330021 RepID=A0A367L2C0_9HYPO|nr:hypothetical protein L249_8833 [Ophiocordyceps polyrhachis-furcata BCC 54312]